MTSISPTFKTLLETSSIGRDLTYDYPETVVGLWPDWTLSFMNNGWFDFAKNNGGERVVEEWPLGSSIMDCMREVWGRFYAKKYRAVLDTNEPWCIEYECSTKNFLRLMHQTVYPVGDSEALLIVHSTSIIRPSNSFKKRLKQDEFRDFNGVVHQCCFCKKFKNYASEGRYEWVRHWSEKPPKHVTHGVCPHCWDFHYPGIRAKSAKK